MSEVSIRHLRNSGGEVVERAAQGERLTITSNGRPVAELIGLPRAPLPLYVVVAHRQHLPVVDPDALRADVDDVLDPST